MARHQMVVAIVSVVGILVSSTASAADWTPPVEAPVADPFRPPADRYGAGNRGIEYAIETRTEIRAVDAGRVTFAGAVAGQRHVVVDHGAGLRSTYAYVDEVLVVRGQRVASGTVVATAGAGFHLTARLGDEYVDPALLFAGAEVGVRLVAGPAPPANGATRPRSILRDGFDDERAVLDALGDIGPSGQIEAAARAVRAWSNQDCTETSAVIRPALDRSGTSDHGPGGNGRVLIQVGGLGSSHDGASIGRLDLSQAGYGSDDVVGFSYNGGCTPTPFGVDPGVVGSDALTHALATSTYDADSTRSDLRATADELADLVQAVAAARPGQPIDIAAHSLGGVVTRLALEELVVRRRSDASIVLPSVIVTIGSPHGGADLATAGVATSDVHPDSWLDRRIGDENADHRVSDAITQIAEAGVHHLDPPDPPPDGVRVVAVAGSLDPVVAAEHAIWPGAVNVVVPPGVDDVLHIGTAHGDLVAAPAVGRELALATAGLAPGCVGMVDVLASVGVGRAIGTGEDAVTVLAGIATWIL